MKIMSVEQTEDLTEEKAAAFRMRHAQFMKNQEYPEAPQKRLHGLAIGEVAS